MPRRFDTPRRFKVLLDPLNSTQTATMASPDTLGSLITAFVTVASDDWRARFLKASTPIGGATPKNTLEAMAGIAREPWANPTALYGSEGATVRKRYVTRKEFHNMEGGGWVTFLLLLPLS